MRRLFVSVLFVLGTLSSIATSPTEVPVCENDDDKAACSERCDEYVAALREPLAAPAPTVGTCTTINDVVGCACREGAAEGAGEGEGEEGAAVEFFINSDVCAAAGRLGECLVPPDSFPGCSLDDAGSCDEVCALLDRQRNRDAAARTDATSVDETCDYTCRCEIKADDRCATVVIYDARGSIDDAFINASSCEL